MKLKTLTSGKTSFDLDLEIFEKIITEVFSGNDEEQKAKLKEKWESITRASDLSGRIQSMDLEAKFPNEIWMKVMSYMKTEDVFGSFPLVCKRFNDLTNDSRSIKYLLIKNIGQTSKNSSDSSFSKPSKEETISFSKILRVLKRSSQLVELSIHFCNELFMKGFVKQALHTSKSLKSLKITNNFIDPYVLVPYGTTTRYALDNVELSKSQLEKLEFIMTDVSHHTMNEICKIKTLKSIRVTNRGQRLFTAEIINQLANADNQLESIEIDDTHWPYEINDSKTALNHLIDKKRSTLKCIKMFGLIMPCNNGDPMKTPCVNLNLSLCQNLEEFDGELHDHDKEMISKLLSLKKLRLAFDNPITTGPVFAMKLPKLTHLSLYFKSAVTHFEIWNCQFLTTYEFPSLERLHLGYFGQTKRYIKLEIIENLLKRSPNLKSIQIDGCDGNFDFNVPNEFLYKIFKETNIFVIHCNILGSEFPINVIQESFEDYLLQVDPNLSQKYQRMKSSFSSWRANVKEIVFQEFSKN